MFKHLLGPLIIQEKDVTTERIIWARYGVREHGQWIDVTEKLKSFSVPTPVSDVIFGASREWNGKPHSLWCAAINRAGSRVEATLAEGAMFTPLGEPLSQVETDGYEGMGGLQVVQAHYGIGGSNDIDVRERLQSLVVNDSLDIIVNNSTLAPGQNPFRGQKKQLNVTYSYDNGDVVTATRQEKEALIIGRPQRRTQVGDVLKAIQGTIFDPRAKSALVDTDGSTVVVLSDSSNRQATWTATALNDYLLRKFSISPYRLRAPMPIELPHFHRNDLAQLFAELGFKRGAEIGVAEGNYSEVLLKANPDCELLLVDPWHAYSDNPQNKSKEKHEYAMTETARKIKPYPNARMVVDYSMNVVRDVRESELDFVYLDGHHSFDFIMSDLIEWSKRVRSGGLVCGDDFIKLDEARWGAGPIEAVQAYVNAHRIPIWYVFQGRKSVDYLWVKP